MPDYHMTDMDVHEIDIKDTTDAIGICHYLIARLQMSGGLMINPATASDETLALCRQMKTYTRRIERLLPATPEPELAELLPAYDFMHRIAFNELPDMNMLRKYRMRVINAWRHGHPRITEGMITTMLRIPARCTAENSGERMFAIYKNILDGWCDSIMATGDMPATNHLHEQYLRLATLFNEKLTDTITDETGVKRHLFEAYYISDFSHMTSSTLKAYRMFLKSAWDTALDFETYLETDNNICRLLEKRPDISRFEQMALTLTA